MKQEIMTIEELAEYLRVSERTIYDWAQKGDIPCGKLGTVWRFKRSEIERWVDARLGASKKAQLPTIVSLSDVLSVDRVLLLDQTCKKDVLTALADRLAGAREVRDREELVREIFNREQLMSTGIGSGIGVPHVRLASISNTVMAMGVCRSPLEDYEALDGLPVQIVCMIAAGRDQHAKHIRILAAIAQRMKDESLKQRIAQAKSPEVVYALMTGEEGHA